MQLQHYCETDVGFAKWTRLAHHWKLAHLLIGLHQGFHLQKGGEIRFMRRPKNWMEVKYRLLILDRCETGVTQRKLRSKCKLQAKIWDFYILTDTEFQTE